MKNNFILLLLIAFLSEITHAQEVKFGKVSKNELQEKFYPTDSTAEAAYLLKKRVTDYEFSNNEGFLIRTEVHERIKIYSKEGLDYANKLISYYKPQKGTGDRISGVKAYSYNLVNGKVEKQKLAKNDIYDEKKSKYYRVRKLALPNVKVGSVIELKYNIVSPYVYVIDDLDYQFTIPVKQFEAKIKIPDYFTFKKHHKGYYNVPVKSTVKPSSFTYNSKTTSSNGWSGRRANFHSSKIEYKTHIDHYKATNIPALKNDESFVVNIDNYSGGIKYELSVTKGFDNQLKYHTTNWNDISKKISDHPSFGDELIKSNYFKNDLEVILAKINTENKIEVIVSILEFVKNKVKWNKYNGIYTDEGVKKAYKNGVGNVADINLILTAMLREAGLNANPVLISTVTNGIPIFPTLKGFNYVISSVDLAEGGTILLDATEKYSSPNNLPVKTLNWRGRKIGKGGYSSWVNLTPKKYALENNNLNFKLIDGEVTGILRSSFTTAYAINRRKTYSDLSKEDLTSKLEEKYNVDIENIRISNKHNPYKDYIQLIKFASEDYTEEINDKVYINPLLFLTSKKNPFKADERKYPVDYVTPWKDIDNITFAIPEGYQIEKLPEAASQDMSDGLGSFKYTISQQGSKIKIQTVLQFNVPVISPQYYKELKQFYNLVVKTKSQKIVLKPM